MKITKETALFILLSLTSIGLFSIRFLYDDANDFLDIDLSSDSQMSKSINYQDMSFISEYLNIDINLEDYHILSNQEKIDYLGLDKDYYDDDAINEHIDNGESYYELVANSDDKSSIGIIVSKPKLSSSIKDLKSLYDKEEIEKLTSEYETKGFSYISVKPYTIDFLKEEHFILDVAYFDQDNNLVHIRDIYMINKQYQGIIRLIGDSINTLDLMEERISIHETKD